MTTISAADLPSLYSIRDESLQRVNDAVAKDMQEVMNLQAKANVLNEAQFYGIEHQHEVFWTTDIQDNHNVEHVILDSQFTPEMQSYLEATDAEYDIMICEDCITSDVLGQKAIDLSYAFGAVGLTNTLGTDELGQGLEVQSFATEATAMAEGGDVSPDLGINQSALDFLHQLYITGTFEGVPVKFFVNPDPAATVVDVTAQTQGSLIVSGDDQLALYVSNPQEASESTSTYKSTVGWSGFNTHRLSRLNSNFIGHGYDTSRANPIAAHLYWSSLIWAVLRRPERKS